MDKRDITEKNVQAEGSSPLTMPPRRNRKIEWHIAALFLFFLCEKGRLRQKTQSKNAIRQVYYSEFKPEFLKTDPSMNSREFPSFCIIIVMYLERRLLLRMIGIESDILRFHRQNVQTFLKVFQKSVLSKKIEENSNLQIESNAKVKNDENSRKGMSRIKKSQMFIDQRFAFNLMEKFGDQVGSMKPVEKNHCATCNRNFPSRDELHSHYLEDQHQIRYNYQRNRKELLAENHSLQISLSTGIVKTLVRQEPLYPNGKDMSEKHMVIHVSGKDIVKGTLCLTFMNLSTSPVTLTDLLKIHKGFEINSIKVQDENDSLFILPNPLPVKLSRGASTRLNVKIATQSVGRNEFFIFFKVFKEKKYVFIMQKLCILVESDFTIMDSVQSEEQFEWKKPVEKVYEIPAAKLVRTRAPKKKKSNGGAKPLQVEDYVMPRGLVNLLNHGLRRYHGMTEDEEELRKKIWKMLEVGLCIDNHKEYFSLLLFIEHHQMSVDILKYRLHDVPLLKTNNSSFLALDVPGLAEKRPSVLRGDSIMVTVKEKGRVEYEGKVEKIENTQVILKFSPKLMDIFIPNMKVDVRFDFSRRPHNLQHQALEMTNDRGLLQYICFPTQFDYFKPKPARISWFNRLVEKNEKQREAVVNILNGSSRPAPYLLFGPPGTGKTVTVVESILQILQNDASAHVLVAAPSNAAADVISSRLLKSMPPSQLMRLYSPCREWCQVPEILKKSCNYNPSSGYFDIPDMAVVLKYKVVAVTMITAGRLVTMKVPIDHFSHIFIDECAQGLEPEALITVAGLLGPESVVKKPPTCLLVLSGDPLQLGPVLRSPIVKKLGLEKSLLERLMTSGEIYQRDCNTNKYNPKVLTKLVQNFRSHPAILDLPNKLFYQGELTPSAEIGITHTACKWELLPKKDVPIIFHGVEGREERDNLSPSYFNTSEIHQVVYYLKEILNSKFCGTKIPQAEIGIISPYRRQVEKIRTSLAKTGIGKEVTVASVEEFQGQERRVIIISTVRSDPQRINLDRVFRLGFLREPKRFNVAVTRAKALLIIIGNPNVLQGDPCWGELLKYCYRLGCYTGIHFTFAQNESDDEEDEEEEDDEFPIPRNQNGNTEVNTNVGWNMNSVIEKFQKLSVRSNDVSDVTKMIEPPWESHE